MPSRGFGTGELHPITHEISVPHPSLPSVFIEPLLPKGFVVVFFHLRGEKTSDDNFEISLQGFKGAWLKKKKKKGKAKQSPKPEPGAYSQVGEVV